MDRDAAAAAVDASLAEPASRRDWQEIFVLLDAALELEPSQHATWLAALPADRARLSPVLEELLRAHADGSDVDFLGVPATFALPTPPDAEALAAQALVGPYRLLRKIGEGGMASVWLAERADGLLERGVALKLPHETWGSASFADRMARERNILASLTHPNIARLYDAGLATDGRPFLALEYVDGQPIDAYAAGAGLTVRDRVALVVQVARAVAHAHARLVVHRDLKPSNILVDAHGQAHLLDFGIAKLIDPSPADGALPTQATLMLGRALTPDYASPEQIRGDAIGTASDIYSLAVVLFELLAGERPYRLASGLGAAALADAVARADPRAPSAVATDAAVQRQLKGDLDAIVARAMRKDSGERYPTVDAFADDLERHLRGDPVSARPDSRWYRLERWVRQHKLETAVGAAIVVAGSSGAVAQVAVLIAIGAGAAVALWQMRVAQRQTAAARSEAAHARQVKEFVLSIFQAASTDTGAGPATTATDLLKAALLRIETELAGRPETAVELMTSIGEGLFGLNELHVAADVLRKAVDLAARELGPRHPHTPAATVVYGSVLMSLDQPKEAIAWLVPAIAEARRHRSTHYVVDGLRWLGSAQLRIGDVEAGLASARAAVEALSTPGAEVREIDALSAWAWIANALNVADRAGMADAARHALVHAKALYGDRVSEPVLTVRLLLAKGMAAEGQDAAALAELDGVLADTVQFFGPDYKLVEAILNYRGHVRHDAGDVVGAIEDFRAQLAVAERRSGDSGANRGVTHAALAKALAAARADDESLAHYETGAKLSRAALGADSVHEWRSMSARVLVLARLGRLGEAEGCSTAVDVSSWATSEVDRSVHAGRVSALRSLQGRHDEAISLAHASVEGLGTHPSKIVRATASAALGKALLAAGRNSEAIAPLREAVRLFAEKQLAISPDQAEAIDALAEAQGAPVEA